MTEGAGSILRLRAEPFEVSVLLQVMARLLGWKEPPVTSVPSQTVLPDQDAEKPVELTWQEKQKRKKKSQD